MKSSNIMSLLLGAGIIFQSSGAWAYSSYNTGLNNGIDSVYGAAAQYIGSCDGCHGSGGQSNTMGTQFGNHFVANQSSNYASVATALGPLDSDGDGYPNSAEFIANTDPSDPNSHPTTPLCTRAAPNLSISPSSKSGLAGSSLVYALSIRNNDSSGCASSTLNLSIGNIAGFNTSLSMQSLVLAPGQSGSSDLTLVSDPNVAPNTYNFSVSMVDSDASISIHAKSVNGSALIQPAPVCARAAPSLTLSPLSQTAEPGQAKTYQLGIINNDSSICPPSSFSVDLAGIVAPLSGSSSVPSVSLNAGASGSVDISILADAATPNGTHSFSIATSNSAVGSLHSKSINGSLQVQAVALPDTTPPSVPANVSSQQLPGKGRYRIQWDASSDDASGVAKYQILVDGVKKAESSRLSIRIKLDIGSHVVTVRAVDGAGNVSADSSPLSINRTR